MEPQKPTGIRGRDHERESILHLIASLSTRTRFLVIKGETGIGKTSLVNQVLEAVKDRATTVTGRCPYTIGAEPYFPVIEALAELGIETLDIKDQDSTVQEQERDGEQSIVMNMETSKREDLIYAEQNRKLHLFKRIAVRIMETVGQIGKPIIIVIDDCQWIDPSSMAVLEYLGHHLRTPGMIVCVIRTDCVKDERHMPVVESEAWIRRIEALEGTTSLTLGPLDNAACDELSIDLFGEECVNDAFTAWLVTITKANPLLMIVMAREILTRKIDICAVDWQAEPGSIMEKFGIPLSIDDMVAHQLERIPERDHDILTAAVVMGNEFEIEVIGQLLDLDMNRVLEAMERLAELGFVNELGSGKFAFQKPVFRESVYRRLSMSRRELLHRTIGERLEARGNATAMELARHYYFGNQPQKAFPWLMNAAELCEQRLAYQSAAQMYRWATQILPDLPENMDEQAVEIYVKLAKNYSKLDEIKDAIQAYDSALGLCEEHRHMKWRIQILIDMGELYILLSDWKKATEVFEKSRKYAHEQAEQASAARALIGLGQIHYRKGQYHDADARFKSALAQLEHDRESSDQLRAEIENQLGNVQYRLGNIAAAIAHYLNVLEAYTTVDYQLGIARIKHRIGMVYHKTQQFNRAKEYYNAAGQIFESVRNRQEQARVLINLGEILYYQCQWDDAIEVWKRSENIDRKIKNEYGLAMVYGLIGKVYMNRGAFDRAKELYTKDFEISAKLGNRLGMAHVYRDLGEMYLLKGKNAMAVNNFNRSLEIFNETGNRYEIAHVHAWLGKAFIEKDMEQAQVQLELAKSGLEIIEEPLKTAEVKMFLGSWHAKQAEFTEAMEYFDQSKQILRMLKRPFESAKLALEIGRVLLALGNETEADAEFQRAKEEFERLNARPYLESVRKAMGLVIL